MKIRQSQFGFYDAKYLQAVSNRKATPIKSTKINNIEIQGKTETNSQETLQLLDNINLSPEAKQLLEKLRTGKSLSKKELQSQAWFALLDKLKKFALKYKGKSKKFKDLKDEDFFNFFYFEFGRERKEDIKIKEKEKNITLDISEDINNLLDKMIIRSPTNSLKLLVKKQLSILPKSVIETVYKFNVKIIILRTNEVASDIKINNLSLSYQGAKTFDGRLADNVRGRYDYKWRLITIGQEQLNNNYSPTIIHEFAHAFDHAYSELKQGGHPLSIKLYGQFLKSRKGFISEYAKTKPAEYFAEHFEAYFNPYLKNKLYKLDKSFYNYINKL